MPTVSLETATLLVQIAFLVGAVTDGLAIIPMDRVTKFSQN